MDMNLHRHIDIITTRAMTLESHLVASTVLAAVEQHGPSRIARERAAIGQDGLGEAVAVATAEFVNAIMGRPAVRARRVRRAMVVPAERFAHRTTEHPVVLADLLVLTFETPLQLLALPCTHAPCALMTPHEWVRQVMSSVRRAGMLDDIASDVRRFAENLVQRACSEQLSAPPARATAGQAEAGR